MVKAKTTSTSNGMNPVRSSKMITKMSSQTLRPVSSQTSRSVIPNLIWNPRFWILNQAQDDTPSPFISYFKELRDEKLTKGAGL
jgi:hypothetical protein